MAGFFKKGILLQQRKEPALSRDLREFLNADTMGLHMDCPPAENPKELSPKEIVERARKANIIDERDGTLLADKLVAARKQNTRLLVADAVDDEPYLSSQLNPVLKNPQLAADGLSFCQKACGASQAYFAVYKNLTEADIRLPKRIGDYSIVRLHGRYPAEYHASLEYAEEDNVLTVGSGAILHLARAILFNKPQTTAFITVAGDCVGNPTNLEVSLGMTVTQALERCGLIDEPHRVVVGGSMTGFSVIDTDRTLITPMTRAVLAFRQDLKTLGLSCIGCVRCVHVCPQGLNPFYLYHSIQHHRYDMMRELDAKMCIGCGTCSYMCPAKLDLSATIYQAASQFRQETTAVQRTAALDWQRDNADYQRFLDDYKLGKSIASHRRLRRRLARQLSASCREAVAARKQSDRDVKLLLAEAQKNHKQAERAAQAELEAAKQKYNAVLALADQKVAEKEKKLAQISKEAEQVLHSARLAANISEAAACQNVLAVVQALRQKFAAVTRAAEKKAKHLEKRDSGKTAEIRQGRDKIAASVEKRRDFECKRALHCAVLAIEHARNAWQNAKKLCQERVGAAENALALAQEEAQKQKEEAAEILEQAQAAFTEAQAQADKILAASTETCRSINEKSVSAWAEATKEIRPILQKELDEADKQLEAVREQALASARASAEADAAVTGRVARSSDFRPPSRLAECEKELLLGRQLWEAKPELLFNLESAGQEQQNLHWSAESFVQAASVRKRSGEEASL